MDRAGRGHCLPRDRKVARTLELKCTEMWMPPHQHHLEHGEVECRMCFLRHDGDLLRNRPRREQPDFPVAKAHRAKLRLEDAGEQLQQGGLAASVRAEQSGERARSNAHADVVQREFAPQGPALRSARARV